ncbi:MAG: efflux RND transporter periplasmic adaptor subunit, partial [bacterium]
PTVSIPLYQQQLIGVQWDTVKIRQVNMTIRTVGHVAYNESQIASVNLKFSGWIEKLYVDYTGQFVRKGQPLFEVYSPELVSTQEEYLQLLQSESRKAAATEPGSRSSKNYGDARQLLETARQRLLLWDISETEIERIIKRGKPATQLTFYSPITGYVIERNVVKGRHVKAGTDLYTIADLSKVWVHADIYEYELPLIRIGQKASVTLSYDPRAIYNGEVDYIYPTLQEKTRTARVRLVLPNPGLKLKPGMYADVEIAVDLGERLTVAETAVLNTGIRQLVFVDKGNGRFEPREIKLGSKAGHYYTVLEGLEPGEVVVKSGNFLIDAEAHVQGVLKSM